MSVYAALANGLPEVSRIENLELPQEIVVLDRTGKTELARFGEFKREVVTFEQIPPILLDATTAVEDKTFWENAGFDPTAIVAAGIDSLRGSAAARRRSPSRSSARSCWIHTSSRILSAPSSESSRRSSSRSA